MCVERTKIDHTTIVPVGEATNVLHDANRQFVGVFRFDKRRLDRRLIRRPRNRRIHGHMLLCDYTKKHYRFELEIERRR